MKNSSTEENLRKAFAGESQANRRYLAFAKKAEEEGLRQVAKLFRAAAEAETVHAHTHLRVLGGIKSTKENLKEAIKGETHEFRTMYPEMIAQAKKDAEATEGDKSRLQALKLAEVGFSFANQVEKIHAKLYENALKDIGKNKETDYFVCPVCGNTVENKAPNACPICGTPGSRFMRIG